MASHAGLILVFRTEEGYIGEKGELVQDINDARLVSFYEAGFSSPLQVFHKLGFQNTAIGEKDIWFETFIPSYDSRLGILESFYQEMGDDYFQACERASLAFRLYHLEDYEKFQSFVDSLKKEILAYYRHTPVVDCLVLDEQVVPLHEVKGKEAFHSGECIVQKYYSDEDQVYKMEYPLLNPHVEKYFSLTEEEIRFYNSWQNEGLVSYLNEKVEQRKKLFSKDFQLYSMKMDDEKLSIYASSYCSSFLDTLNKEIREWYMKKEMHITRMFGSYVLLQRKEERLKAVLATSVPIQYCPLMVKLLKEVGGEKSQKLIDAISTEDLELQKKMMCQLIDEVVIKGGYFDTNRPLNSCEVNVLFGASETISSAFASDLIDAAVIVSNNLGTIITTNASNTQGAVKRMTGLFYTSPNVDIVHTAFEAKIIPVFPYTAKIDQIAGVKEAIRRGYKKIAVTFAAQDNLFLKELEALEKNGVVIYKFGLCSTGIDKDTALIMQNHADIIWSCASKYIKEYIEPNAIAQVGVKIPVHIMTKRGWELVKNHLQVMNAAFDASNTTLVQGDEKPVFIHSSDGIKKLSKKNVKGCCDCPSPCV